MKALRCPRRDPERFGLLASSGQPLLTEPAGNADVLTTFGDGGVEGNRNAGSQVPYATGTPKTAQPTQQVGPFAGQS